MTTPAESATLILKLFELRQNPLLREARQWWLAEFTPRDADELIAIISGERNSFFRMTAGYWDMAASLVTFGAIDDEMFRAANPEIYATVSKVHPFLDQLRRPGSPDFMKHAESVVVADPRGVERMQVLREQFLARRG